MSIKQGSNYISGLQQDITSKANVSLNNLTATGKNIANWSSNVSNCITYIPQDIKLELNNGTLTLKAGSKVYVPNGSGVFDKKTTTQDITISVSGSQQVMVCVRADIANGIDCVDVSRCYSGSTNPGQTYSFWYDTTSNLVKMFTENTSTPARTESLPIAIITVSDGTLFSIDQVFNGFGYIGSTVFVLPGVKGLIPDGRNADGSLKNIETEITNVQITSGGATDQKNIYADVRPEGTLSLNGEFKYDEKNNITYNGVDIAPQFVIAKFDKSGGKITNFTPKTVFHAVDYNDTEYIAHQAMLSDRYVDLTLGASGATYTAPADGWFAYYHNGISTSAFYTNNGLYGYSARSDSGIVNYNMIQVKKGTTVILVYNGSGGVQLLRFVYSVGSAL